MILSIKKYFFAALLLTITSCGNNNKTDNNFEVTAEEINNKQVPSQNANIEDQENIFDNSGKDKLLKTITKFENETTTPVVVHTTATINNFETFTEYADNIGSKWDYCKNNKGLLFIISVKLGELRVITCEKTERQINETDFEKMINEILYANFRENNFVEGIIKSLDYLAPILKNN